MSDKRVLEYIPGRRVYMSDDVQALRQHREQGIPGILILTAENSQEDTFDFPYVIENPEEVEEAELRIIYNRLLGISITVLETSRCRLREITVADLPRLYQLYEDPAISKWVEALYDYEQEKEYTENYIRYAYGLWGFGIWIVEDRFSGEVIGRAGLERQGESLEMGYMLAESARGHGLATEICREIITFAKQKTEDAWLYCRVDDDNTASCALLRKLGFARFAKGDAHIPKNYSEEKLEIWGLPLSEERKK